MWLKKNANLFIGRIAAAVLPFFAKRGRSGKVSGEELKKGDFPVIAQKMGVSFTEKIRNKFRSRWIKKV